VLGRGVANFAPVEWDGCKQLIVYHALMAKFGQNPDLCGRLITTGTATPVECSRADKVWVSASEYLIPMSQTQTSGKGKTFSDSHYRLYALTLRGKWLNTSST